MDKLYDVLTNGDATVPKKEFYMNTSSQPPKLDDLLEALRSPGQTSTGVDVQNLPWPFCILYDGEPYQSQIFFAPDPNSAAITANQFVQLLNQAAQSLGYPALFSVISGSCTGS